MSKVDMNVYGGAMLVNKISCRLKWKFLNILFWMFTIRTFVLNNKLKMGLKCIEVILGYVFTPFIIIIS